MLHEMTQTSERANYVLTHYSNRKSVDWKEPSHILVPTALRPSERPAITLALQMAGASGTRVTLLHVVSPPPAPEQGNPWNWLDALDNLQRSLSTDVHASPQRTDLEKSRTVLANYLETEFPGYAQCGAEIHVECREGDIADEIVRFVGSECVDLVILSSDFSYWGLPFVPPRIQRLLQQMDKRVIVVRREEVDCTTGSRSHADRNGTSSDES